MPLGMNYRDFIMAAQAGGPALMAATPEAGWRPSRGGIGSIPLFGAVARAAGPAVAASNPALGVALTALQPGSDPAAVLPGQGQYGAATPSYCNLITNQIARAACIAASQLIGGGGGSAPATTQCPPGYKPNAQGGCTIEGMGGWLPGDVGRPDVIWTPVNGRYGAGVSPMAVQATRMWCPAGYKLGKDNVCYECLGKKERKWNPGTKPFMTGGDLNAVARVRRLKKRGRRMAATLGLNTTRTVKKGKRK